MTSDSSRQELREYADRERQRFEDALRDSVEIPSVSVDPEHKEDVRREAEFAADLIQSLGGIARVYSTAGHPIVHGRFDRGEGLPTVTVYNHLDVQPAGQRPGRLQPAIPPGGEPALRRHRRLCLRAHPDGPPTALRCGLQQSQWVALLQPYHQVH